MLLAMSSVMFGIAISKRWATEPLESSLSTTPLRERGARNAERGTKTRLRPFRILSSAFRVPHSAFRSMALRHVAARGLLRRSVRGRQRDDVTIVLQRRLGPVLALALAGR